MRRKVRVNGFSGRDWLAPRLVKPLELITEADPLRYGQAKRGIAERDPLLTARNVNRAFQRDRAAIRQYGLDMCDRGSGIISQARGIDDGNAAIQRKPDSPPRVANHGSMSFYAFYTTQPVRKPVL